MARGESRKERKGRRRREKAEGKRARPEETVPAEQADDYGPPEAPPKGSQSPPDGPGTAGTAQGVAGAGGTASQQHPARGVETGLEESGTKGSRKARKKPRHKKSRKGQSVPPVDQERREPLNAAQRRAMRKAQRKAEKEGRATPHAGQVTHGPQAADARTAKPTGSETEGMRPAPPPPGQPRREAKEEKPAGYETAQEREEPYSAGYPAPPVQPGQFGPQGFVCPIPYWFQQMYQGFGYSPPQAPQADYEAMRYGEQVAPPIVPLPPEGAVYPPLPDALPAASVTPEEKAQFEELAVEGVPHWRVDLKWAFGVLTAFLVLISLAVTGLYRMTSPGEAKNIQVPMIEKTTEVKEEIEDDYQKIRSRALKSEGGEIVVYDEGIEVTMDADTVASLSSEDLAEQAINEIQDTIYKQGYKGNLPMKYAQGVGEERARAVCNTVLSSFNRNTHGGLPILMIILGVLALAAMVPFIIFCRGWGKVVGPGIVLMVAALPGSLLIRIANEFVWNSGSSGLYAGAMDQALRASGSDAVLVFDIVLALGAVLLLGGVIGGALTRRVKVRVPPFTDLEQPEGIVMGGPPLSAGTRAPDQTDRQQEVPGGIQAEVRAEEGPAAASKETETEAS